MTRNWLAAITVITLMIGSATAAEEVVGRASVVDGDTIDLGGVRVRFNGIDAPESWQRCEQSDGKSYRCGRQAALRLDEFLAASRPTRCQLLERERGHGSKRWIGVCRRADGKDVNAWLVLNGHAVDWPRYSGGRYAAFQARAKASSAGIWRGTFELPCIARAKRMKREPNCG